MTKFRHLPAAGRAIIVVVAIGVLAIAVVACATSYNAIYRLVGQLGLYGYRINQLFPLLLDAAFLVAELAAILGGIMRAVTRSDEVSAGWPGAAMLLCGLGTIGFNVGHAYLLGGRGDPLTIWRCIVASLPPVLMMVSFQVLIAIVKWVMLHLGRPLNSAAALSPTMVPGMVPAPGPWAQMPSWAPAPSGQTGHGNGEAAIRPRVEQYLTQLGPDELARMTKGELADTMAAHGVDVSVRYAGQILDEYRVGLPTPARRGSGDNRRRGGR
jgi:hypothetical protein